MKGFRFPKPGFTDEGQAKGSSASVSLESTLKATSARTHRSKNLTANNLAQVGNMLSESPFWEGKNVQFGNQRVAFRKGGEESSEPCSRPAARDVHYRRIEVEGGPMLATAVFTSKPGLRLRRMSRYLASCFLRLLGRVSVHENH